MTWFEPFGITFGPSPYSLWLCSIPMWTCPGWEQSWLITGADGKTEFNRVAIMSSYIKWLFWTPGRLEVRPIQVCFYKGSKNGYFLSKMRFFNEKLEGARNGLNDVWLHSKGHHRTFPVDSPEPIDFEERMSDLRTCQSLASWPCPEKFKKF
jgi:hypothetical protein